MTLSPEQQRELLRRFMQERELKIADWSRDAGISRNVLYNFLNGHTERLDYATYAKLAKAARVPAWLLTGDEPELPSARALTAALRVLLPAFFPGRPFPETSVAGLGATLRGLLEAQAQDLEAADDEAQSRAMARALSPRFAPKAPGRPHA